MTMICLIDTSVFLNFLNVHGKNQEVKKIIDDYKTYVEVGCTFILPMATIIETGNHISQNGDGNARRKTAFRFIDAVKGAFNGDAPWQPSEFLNAKEIMDWIDTFPDYAMCNKSSEKPNKGISFGDLSIIKEYNKCCERFTMSEIFIWSLDKDLAGYYRKQKI